MFNLTHAINIIDWKMKNNVPRGEQYVNNVANYENFHNFKKYMYIYI